MMAIGQDRLLFNAYLQHYQRGRGAYFSGIPFQHGGSFKDKLRAGLRFVSPIVSRFAESFLGEAAGALSRGANLKDAAKAALAPSLKSGLSRAVERISTGQGKRRRKKRRTIGKGKTDHLLNHSRHGRKRHKTHTGGKRRKAKHYKRHAKSNQKQPKFPFSNF